MNVALVHKLRGSSKCLAHFVTHDCLYNQALVDVRSTGSSIDCLYCIYKAERGKISTIVRTICTIVV